MGTSNWLLTLPVATFAWADLLAVTVGSWSLRDDSVPNHLAGTLITATAATGVWFGGAGGSGGRVTDTNPVTWAAGDVLSGVLDYRAA